MRHLPTAENSAFVVQPAQGRAILEPDLPARRVRKGERSIARSQRHQPYGSGTESHLRMPGTRLQSYSAVSGTQRRVGKAAPWAKAILDSERRLPHRVQPAPVTQPEKSHRRFLTKRRCGLVRRPESSG